MVFKRELKKWKNYSSSNPLPLQRHAIRNTMFDYLGVSGFLFIVLIVMLLLDSWDDKVLDQPIYISIMFLIMVGMFMFYLSHFIFCFIVFRKFVKIQYTSEHAVSINCQRVSFMLKMVSKFSSAIAYIILTDEKGNKFTYVYPEDKEPSDLAKKDIKGKYIGKRVELICYKNTNIVKRF